MYKLREVDPIDEADTIREFNRMEPQWPALRDEELEGENCHWWLAYLDDEPVAFAGLVPSRLYDDAGYLKRSGVLPEHRGHGLQIRFFRTRERKARSIGWNMLVSETTDTLWSANNFIKAGYKLFEPKERWAFKNSLYWKKDL